MKKIFTLLMAVIFCFFANAQSGLNTRSMTWGDTERQYLEYVPSSYNASTPAPVLFVLHGLGDNMSNMFNATGFRQIADAHGWIVITPQALNATISLMGYSYEIGAAWHSGASGSLGTMNIVVNEEVDDAGFLMAILDDLIANYNVDQNNVFCTGFSMGGFMSNRMAMEHGDRIKAIASVSGTIGNEIADPIEPQGVALKHFVDSLLLLRYCEIDKDARVIDVGTGAGFPGLVLKMARKPPSSTGATTTSAPPPQSIPTIPTMPMMARPSRSSCMRAAPTAPERHSSK